MTIRSIVLRPHGAYVGAGGGITWLSDPEEEVAEVGLKARAPSPHWVRICRRDGRTGPLTWKDASRAFPSFQIGLPFP
jgi:hypothetical protein